LPTAFRQIYAAAGWWNDHWGRVKTLALLLGFVGAVVLVVGGLLVSRFGVLGTVAIVVGGLFLTVAMVAFLVHQLTTTRRVVFPDVEFYVHGTGFELREEEEHGMTITRTIVPLRSVRATNHERVQSVSLTFHAKFPLQGLPGWEEQLLYPITSMPIDVPPQTSRTFDIEFEKGLVPPGVKESGPMVIEVEDHLSGLRTGIPILARWRPAVDGEWTGAFPGPDAS
jgi:hypothetical protein